MNRSRSGPLVPVQTLVLLQGLEFLARLEANRLPGWDCHFSTCPGVASDSGFPRPHIENPEPAQLNPVPLAQSLFHSFKHCLDRHFGFGLSNPRAVYDLIDDVKLDQGASRAANVTGRSFLDIIASEMPKRCNVDEKREVTPMSITYV